MLRRSYSFKPPLGAQIISGHPLARGLKLCSLFNEGGGPYSLDLASMGRKGTITNGVWRPFGVYLDGDGDYISFPQINYDLSGGGGGSTNPAFFTISILCNIVSYSQMDRILETKVNWNDIGGWTIQLNNNWSRFEIIETGTSVTPLQLFSLNVWAEYTFSHWGTGPGVGTDKGYVNGILKVSPAIENLIYYQSASNPLYIGRYGAGGGDPELAVKHIFFWDRVLLDQEVTDFYTNPYAMFEQPRRGKWFAAGGVPVEVSGTTDALVLTENVAVIKADRNVLAGIDALVVAGKAATVNAKISIAAGIDALVVAGKAATVNAKISIAAGVDALVLATNAASVKLNASVTAQTDALVLTGNAAVIKADISISANIATLTLTENNATVMVGGDVDVQATTDALALSAKVASIKADTSIVAGIDALAITENAASVKLNISISAATDALVLVGNVAAIKADTSIVAGVDNLVITENAATVEAGGDVFVSATTDALLLAAFSAVVNVNNNVSANYDSLILMAYGAKIKFEQHMTFAACPGSVDALSFAACPGSVDALSFAVCPGSVDKINFEEC